MEFFKKNIPVAAIALVLIFALALPLGTLRSVNSVKSDVKSEFTKKDRFGETVENTLDAFSLHLSQFCTEYERAAGEDKDSKALRLFIDTLDGFTVASDAKSPEKLLKLTVSMRERLSKALALTDEATRAFASIDSDMAILKRYEDYNKAAESYNEIVSSFIGHAFGLDAAVQFN